MSHDAYYREDSSAVPLGSVSPSQLPPYQHNDATLSGPHRTCLRLRPRHVFLGPWLIIRVSSCTNGVVYRTEQRHEQMVEYFATERKLTGMRQQLLSARSEILTEMKRWRAVIKARAA